MRERGYHVWYDADIQAGKQWTDELASSIAKCAAFMPLVSDSYGASEYCMQEIRYAKSKKTVISPVFLTDTHSLSDDLQFQLEHLHGFSLQSASPGDFVVWMEKQEIFRPCRATDAVSASAELVTNERPVERIQAISFDGTEKLLNSLNGEPTLEHCRKPRQENSAVPQKTEVHAKQDVPQKPDDVQSNPNTQRKENAKHTPPKEPKKVISSDRSEDIREKRKTNFDACRSHFKVWSIIALITLALTILAYYTDEPRVYLAMEDEIRLNFWGGILGCFITVNNLGYKFIKKKV